MLRSRSELWLTFYLLTNIVFSKIQASPSGLVDDLPITGYLAFTGYRDITPLGLRRRDDFRAEQHLVTANIAIIEFVVRTDFYQNFFSNSNRRNRVQSNPGCGLVQEPVLPFMTSPHCGK